MARPIHGSDRGRSSRSRPPRTMEEACAGFDECDIPYSWYFPMPEEERILMEQVLDLIPQWQRPWRGSEHDWLELNNLLNRELRNMPSSSSSSSSGDEAAHFEQHYEYSPPAGGTSRRPAAYGRADRAGGYPSDMPSSRYGPERRRSIPETRDPPPPYTAHPEPRNAGGNRDDGRTRAQGSRVAGSFRYGQGNLRRQEGPNARDSSESSDDYFPDDAGNSRSNTRDRDPLRGHNVTAQGPADPWESDSSMILDATHPRAQAGMHSTSSRHNATNRRANSAEREVIMNRSERTGLPYGERSTHIW